MRLVPLGAKVVVRRTPADERSPGGILLPDTARQKAQQGRVLSVGDGLPLSDGSRAKPQVAEGDRVLFPSYAGTEVVMEGDELLILDERDILAIIA